ncbi:ABC transporter permease [Gordonia soli]|uniref:Putative dipeptide ABC transporter permease protein n=1 Tax=Gordonia soli NBRC 108243 TaxID=1223545 RepID=M0QQ19_9ACTN|nr:ABC transporter permease [Gordonia soli]GAC70479.1 putative dipeptide ABC transporter permease protein [Gordonia soli NBRC 108243]
MTTLIEADDTVATDDTVHADPRTLPPASRWEAVTSWARRHALALRILGRVLLLVPVLFVISILVFLLGKASPGDPIKASLHGVLSPDAIADLQQAYGLDDGVVTQYLTWVSSLFTSGGGRSILNGSRVFDTLGTAFANTLVLTAAAVVVSLVFGVAIGTIAALNHNRFVDRAIMLLVQVGSNLSVYWFGLILIWLFALQWKVLPATGMRDTADGGGLLSHLILPAISAALISMLILARFARAGVIESLESDYIRTLRSQGLPRWRILTKHVGRNVAPLIITTTGLEIGTLLSGAVFVEFVFSWPGVGTDLMNAISAHDYPVIQGGVMLVTVVFVVVNLVTDVIGDLLDPRLRS